MSIRNKIFFRGATQSKTPYREKQAAVPGLLDPIIQEDLSTGLLLHWRLPFLNAGRSSNEIFHGGFMGGMSLLAITIDIKQPSGNIYITAWKRGAIQTRLHPNPEPRAIQEIKIFRSSHPQPILTGGDLVIPFHQIMLRNPTGPREGAFIFTKDDLWELAEGVWDAMDRM
ncbi:hypothetical protein AJ80_09590 [Polytolypa hystricis UAMH7299]|uniref:Uncharacterized protein n=1 Tax=Polytolypa hystricis (strain UAMH7299) TaxID=1447883 RepID=A0A2B7WN72_POLH7|nr:hypothetical protein AJ80_09590 [Polytolypa hystricis UAMH7299]